MMLSREELAARFAVVDYGAKVATIYAGDPSQVGGATFYDDVAEEAFKMADAFLDAAESIDARPVNVALAPVEAVAPVAKRPYVYSHLRNADDGAVAWAITSGAGEYDSIRWTLVEAIEEVDRLNSDEYGHDKQKVVMRRPFRITPLAPVAPTPVAPVDPVREAERAVVEAAEAVYDNGYGFAKNGLLDAIDALRAARKAKGA